jgi:hypothetical protein
MNRIKLVLNRFKTSLDLNDKIILMNYYYYLESHHRSNNNKPKNRWERKVIKTIDSKESVNNLSSRILTELELTILTKNLKYIPKGNIPNKIYDNEFTKFKRDLKVKDYFLNENSNNHNIREWLDLMSRNKSWVPPITNPLVELKNLDYRVFVKPSKNHKSINEINILMDILKDNSIRICESDKNLGITIVDNSWYITEIQNQVNDPSTYEIKSPNINTISNKIRECIGLMKLLPNLPYGVSTYVRNFIRPDVWKLPKFYVIPKIHKTPLKGRPIVPSHKWLTAGLSSVIDRLLRPLLAKCHTVLRDSKELVRELENSTMDFNVTLATADVISLYPNIDINDCVLRVVRMYIKMFGIDTKMIKLLKVSLETILNENFFVIPNGTIYHQIKGIAMGTPIAPLLANIYMYSLESDLLEQDLSPIFYKRYIDDLFMIFENTSENNVIEFLNQITNKAPNIKFTTNVKLTKVEFLDLVIYKGERFKSEETLDIRTHEKDLNKYLYIPYDSGHSKHLKSGFIKGETIRHARNCSSKIEFDKKMILFKHRLSKRGYPEKFIDNSILSVNYNNRKSFLDDKEKELNKDTLFFPITYSEQLNYKKLKKFLMDKLKEFKEKDSRWNKIEKISFAFKSHNSIKRIINNYYAKTRSVESNNTEIRLKQLYGKPFVPHKRRITINNPNVLQSDIRSFFRRRKFDN